MAMLPCPICQKENEFTSTCFDVEETCPSCGSSFTLFLYAGKVSEFIKLGVIAIEYRDSHQGQAKRQLDRITFPCSCGRLIDFSLRNTSCRYERPIYVVTGGLHIVCPTCSRIFYAGNRGGVLELEQTYPDGA
jgi:hypothetical protein